MSSITGRKITDNTFISIAAQIANILDSLPMSMSNFSFRPGLPTTSPGKIWAIRFSDQELELPEHPLFLYLSSNEKGIIRNVTTEPINIPPGSKIVTKTRQKYPYSINYADGIISVRSGVIKLPNDDIEQRTFLNRKITSVPQEFTNIRLPPFDGKFQDILTIDELRRQNNIKSKGFANAVYNHFKGQKIITKRQIINALSPDQLTYYETESDWWENYARPKLNQSDLLQRADDTNRRWKLK